MANDGGYLLLSESEKQELLSKEPASKQWLRRFIGADEFLYGLSRWCLWLRDISPSALRLLPEISRCVAAVKHHREQSRRSTTRALAAFPTLFGEIRQPDGDYLAVPRVTSEHRAYIPIGFIRDGAIASDRLAIIPNARLFHFGILSSAMHMAWVNYTCGRLESRINYSNNIVYNNFPWPDQPTGKRTEEIEQAAQSVLDARLNFRDASLADLYNPNTMPPALTQAHQALDRAVDAAYGKKDFKSDAERVAFLFELYQQYTSLLPADKPAKRKRIGK